MNAENGSLFPSSIPEGPEGAALRAEAERYPAWRAMHAGEAIVSTQVEMSPVIINGGDHAGEVPLVEAI